MRSHVVIEKPTSFAELKGMIAATEPKLSKNQERLARTAVAHPEIVAFGTVHSLADHCAVSQSTVMRLAISLGFGSFREFRQVFRHHIRANTGFQR